MLAKGTTCRSLLENLTQEMTHQLTQLDTLAQETRMAPCRFECGLALMQDALKHHEAHECPKRTISCQECGEALVAKDERLHLEQQCRLRGIRCPNVYLGCEAKVPAQDRENHLKRFCMKRNVMCRLGCGQEFHFDQVHVHEVRTGGSVYL